MAQKAAHADALKQQSKYGLQRWYCAVKGSYLLQMTAPMCMLQFLDATSCAVLHMVVEHVVNIGDDAKATGQSS